VLGLDTSNVEDKGHENMLELGPCVADDAELTPPGELTDDEAATGADIVDADASAVVRPKGIRVDVVAIAEDAIVVAAEL
jgi:hypothetical protein